MPEVHVLATVQDVAGERGRRKSGVTGNTGTVYTNSLERRWTRRKIEIFEEGVRKTETALAGRPCLTRHRSGQSGKIAGDICTGMRGTVKP